MDLLPVAAVGAGQHDDARRGEEHVAVGAAAKGQIQAITETAHIREGIMTSVIEQLTYGTDSDGGHESGSCGNTQVLV